MDLLTGVLIMLIELWIAVALVGSAGDVEPSPAAFETQEECQSAVERARDVPVVVAVSDCHKVEIKVPERKESRL